MERTPKGCRSSHNHNRNQNTSNRKKNKSKKLSAVPAETSTTPKGKHNHVVVGSKKKRSTKIPSSATKQQKKAAPSHPPISEESSSHSGEGNASDDSGSAESSTSSDMYARHWREFEKSLDRLERTDTYGFFIGEIPEEFDNDNDDNNVYVPKNPPYNFKVIRRRMAWDRYTIDRTRLFERMHKPFWGSALASSTSSTSLSPLEKRSSSDNKKNLAVDWDVFREDIVSMCQAASERDPYGCGGSSHSGTVSFTAKKIKDLTESLCLKIGQRQTEEAESDFVYQKLVVLVKKNKEAAMQTWRKEPFDERKYLRIEEKHVGCSGLNDTDDTANELLTTELPDSFVGMPYNYDDVDQSEDWMKAVTPLKLGCVNDGMVKAQVRNTLETMLISVQDRVLTSANVLHEEELTSFGTNSQLSEQPVWGIDCFSRKNVMGCLSCFSEYEPHAVSFVEKWLLPAINASPQNLAHDIRCAAALLEGKLPPSPSSNNDNNNNNNKNNTNLLTHTFLERVQSSGPDWLPGAARLLRVAADGPLGSWAFRAHPKGHGALALRQIEANTLVTFYRGEIYPPWRWGEKMDAIEMTQNQHNLRPVLPDFYNMVLERPRIDPRGYGLLFVDASRKAGLGSAFSHSCTPTCSVHVVALHGKLTLAITSLRKIYPGEELTFDYNAVTESLSEYMSAVCLCGHHACRGSFLHYATAECYQQVLLRNAPVAFRLSSLIRASAKQVMSSKDSAVLERHGFREAAFGAVSLSISGKGTIENVPIWLRTYTADVLRYIEYERRALPVALVCNHITKSRRDAAAAAKAKQSPSSQKQKTCGAGAGAGDTSADKHTKKTKKKKCEKPHNEETSSHSDDNNTNDNDTHSHSLTLKQPPPKKPLTPFLHFSKVHRQTFKEIYLRNGGPELKGLELSRALTAIASNTWKSMDDEQKQRYKQLSEDEFRQKQNQQNGKKDYKPNGIVPTPPTKKKKKDSKSNHKTTNKTKSKKHCNPNITSTPQPQSQQNNDNDKNVPISTKISFQEADSEGRLLMEQRIQALSQSLSRVGRVLAHHCDYADRIHPPLSILSETEIVDWLWNQEGGLVQTIHKFVNNDRMCPSYLRKSVNRLILKYHTMLRSSEITVSSSPQQQNSPSENTDKQQQQQDTHHSVERRKKLNQALLALREEIITAIQKADADEHLRKRSYTALSQPTTTRSGTSTGTGTDNTNDEDALFRKRSAAALKGALTKKLKKKKILKKEYGETSIQANNNNHREKTLHVQEHNNRRDNALSDHPKLPTKQTQAPTTTSMDEDAIFRKRSAAALKGALTKKLKKKTLQGKTLDNSNSLHDREHAEASSSSSSKENKKDSVMMINAPAPPFSSAVVSKTSDLCEEKQKKKKWVDKFKRNRYKLESMADLLLFYANTGTFFKMNTYAIVKSAPIEVYARELGNEVPLHILDEPPRKSATQFCHPSQVVASVVREYSPSYVLFQLLQWFTGGIGSKDKNTPGMLGCVRLPHVSTCISDKTDVVVSSSTEKSEEYSSDVDVENDTKSEKLIRPQDYATQIRPCLVQWLADDIVRGSPWTDELKFFFSSTADDGDNIVLGSPVLDRLVTGDDQNIQKVLEGLRDCPSTGERKKEELPDLFTKVDEGVPIQAKVNWAQCDACGKWRKIPFHVDLDMLPDKFVCKDNLWTSSNSCDVPEDEYDDNDAIIE